MTRPALALALLLVLFPHRAVAEVALGDFVPEHPLVPVDPRTVSSERGEGGELVPGLARVYRFRGDDDRSEAWMPQGLTGLRVGDSQGERRLMLVSWYSKRDSARVSLVEVGPGRPRAYSHALLLDPDARGGWRPNGTHAGGLAALGDRLYVTETGHGVRVYDLARLREEGDLPALGAASDLLATHGCRYALLRLPDPEGRIGLADRLREAGVDKPRFSFSSLWRGPDGDRLLTGAYAGGYDRDYWVDRAVHLWKPEPGGSMTLEGHWKNGADGFRILGRPEGDGLPDLMQGASLVGHEGVRYLLASRSGSPASLRMYRLAADPDRWTEVGRRPWPYGTEGLHVSISGNLWGLTEHPGHRYLFHGRIGPLVTGMLAGNR